MDSSIERPGGTFWVVVPRNARRPFGFWSSAWGLVIVVLGPFMAADELARRAPSVPALSVAALALLLAVGALLASFIINQMLVGFGARPLVGIDAIGRGRLVRVPRPLWWRKVPISDHMSVTVEVTLQSVEARYGLWKHAATNLRVRVLESSTELASVMLTEVEPTLDWRLWCAEMAHAMPGVRITYVGEKTP